MLNPKSGSNAIKLKHLVFGSYNPIIGWFLNNPNIGWFKSDPNIGWFKSDPNIGWFKSDPNIGRFKSDPNIGSIHKSKFWIACSNYRLNHPMYGLLEHKTEVVFL